ncbi:MAG: hypothetical protein U0903_11920 [Planctomycetales bacterium]
MFDPLDSLLPAPRDDEPASLRQDIIDEVRDHLHSALLRELHRTPDENLAKQNVLQRFGDPAALVRKLWLQALRDKIMTQKILSTSALLMAVACLIGVLFMGQLVQQNQKANADLIQQMKESNAQLVAQFQSLASQRKTESAPLSPEWCSLKLRFSLDKPAGPPAKGFRAWINDLSGSPQGERQIPVMNFVVNDTGVIDFGYLKFGRYQLNVTSPSGINLSSQILTLRPQQNVSGEIVCPSATPQDVSLTAEPRFVDKNEASKILFLCEFVSNPLIVDQRDWLIPPYTNRPYPIGGMGGFGGGGFGGGGFGVGQGVGGGGFGGGGMFNIIDRLDDQVLQPGLPSSAAGAVLRVIVTTGGDLIDLTTVGSGGDLVGQSLPDGFFSRASVADLRFMNWSYLHESAAKSLNWHGVEMRLRSIIILSLPQNYYVQYVQPESPETRRISTVNVLTPPLLVSKLPTDHPLRLFTARPGETNKLVIDVSKFPLDWQLEIDRGRKKFAPLQQELKEYWEKKDKTEKTPNEGFGSGTGRHDPGNAFTRSPSAPNFEEKKPAADDTSSPAPADKGNPPAEAAPKEAK